MDKASKVKTSNVSSVKDSRNRRILYLITAHVIAGSLGWIGIPTQPFLAFPQSSLVAFWFTFSSSHNKGWRLAFGLLGLSLLNNCCSGPVMFLLNFAIFSGYRVLLKLKLQRVVQYETHDIEFQFSIRQLMLITVVVAALLAVAKAIRATEAASIVGGLYILVGLLVIGPLASWAALGRSRPILPSIIVLLASPLLAVATSFALGDFGDVDAVLYVWVTAVYTIDTLILLASFFVIRSCGYRFLPAAKSKNFAEQ